MTVYLSLLLYLLSVVLVLLQFVISTLYFCSVGLGGIKELIGILMVILRLLFAIICDDNYYKKIY
jgi:hypothetical protein